MRTDFFSPVFMAVLTSNLLIIIMVVFFRSQRLLIRAGYKVLAVLMVLIVVRMLFPFEIPFSRNVYLPEFISRVFFKMRVLHNIGKWEISLWGVFCLIWIAGAIGLFLRYILQYRRTERLIRSRRMNIAD